MDGCFRQRYSTSRQRKVETPYEQIFGGLFSSNVFHFYCTWNQPCVNAMLNSTWQSLSFFMQHYHMWIRQSTLRQRKVDWGFQVLHAMDCDNGFFHLVSVRWKCSSQRLGISLSARINLASTQRWFGLINVRFDGFLICFPKPFWWGMLRELFKSNDCLSFWCVWFKYMYHVLILGKYLSDDPDFIYSWAHPSNDKTMYTAGIAKDWSRAHFRDCGWYLDLPK